MQRLTVSGDAGRVIFKLTRKRPSVYVIEETCNLGILKTVSSWLSWGLHSTAKDEYGDPMLVTYLAEDPNFLSRLKESIEMQYHFDVELEDIPEREIQSAE